jgi:hypothetical protein
MALFGGSNRWWRTSSSAPVKEFRPRYRDPEREALRPSVLQRRYPATPIYRAMAIARGCDPLRAVELQ